MLCVTGRLLPPLWLRHIIRCVNSGPEFILAQFHFSIIYVSFPNMDTLTPFFRSSISAVASLCLSPWSAGSSAVSSVSEWVRPLLCGLTTQMLGLCPLFFSGHHGAGQTTSFVQWKFRYRQFRPSISLPSQPQINRRVMFRIFFQFESDPPWIKGWKSLPYFLLLQIQLRVDHHQSLKKAGFKQPPKTSLYPKLCVIKSNDELLDELTMISANSLSFPSRPLLYSMTEPFPFINVNNLAAGFFFLCSFWDRCI